MSFVVEPLMMLSAEATNIMVTGAQWIVRETPTLLLAGLGLLGFLTIWLKFCSYFRMIGSLYLMKGTNVRCELLRPSRCSSTPY